MEAIENDVGVLILTDAAHAADFRARAPRATVLTDTAILDGMEERFDRAIVDGVLEDERWDRWMLQRVHRSLRMGGTIEVVVPRLDSLRSVADLRFLAYASRCVLRRAVETLRPGFDVPGRVRRRYSLPALARKMESVGYTALRPGAPGGSRWRLTARKARSMPGREARRVANAEAHRRAYAEEFPAIAASREAWLARFPEFRQPTARQLEPAEWRGARVLVLSPHPDDELIGCGGTLSAVLEAGASVSVLQATDGSKLPSLAELPAWQRKTVRLDEARRVAAQLGARVILWRHEDGALRCNDSTVAHMRELLHELRPTHVFTPFLGDKHGDHHALSLILAGALAEVAFDPQVLQYEVWSLVPANLYCDVTQRADQLERLLWIYESAMRVENFVHFCETRNFARALELTGLPGYVEAFLALPATGYRSLAARHEG